MDTKALEKFAQSARRQLHEQVAAKLDRVLQTDSAELRAKAKTVEQLRREIARTSREAVVERVAYTWFNRFCALRYMDVNHYTRMGIVSPAAGFTQPEILQEAKQGHIDERLGGFIDRGTVLGLLGGRLPSADPQAEAYRLLLVAVCNYYHTVMPFMFEPIDDYTELLMPDDLLSSGSILQAVRDALAPDTCRDAEVVGWLYQFYISEKKDKVIGAKKPIAPEDIPAATQLFTPHWIVQYLVENTLGRLWLLNRPDSRLTARMDYYVRPEQKETDFQRFGSPEEIKICDPAVGSGHMLTYAFDLLYAIYEEEGYNPIDIPRLIIRENLYGIEIDERAGALAAFALVMKARERDGRFFRRGVLPNIIVLRPIAIEEEELTREPWLMTADHDLRIALLHDLALFREADNLGSLLRPEMTAMQIESVRERVGAESPDTDLFVYGRSQLVLRVMEQVQYLARKYHVVIANPPYMGSRNMNARLKSFLNKNYTMVKSDLFSSFIVRGLDLALPKGQLGFMTPFVWMFISSYEDLRHFLIEEKTITSLVQLEYSGFEGATVPICTFTLENALRPNLRGAYVRLSDFRGAANQPTKTLEAIKHPHCGWFFRALAADFTKIPGSPIAYWVNNRVRQIYAAKDFLVASLARSEGKNVTTDNDRFIRCFWEVNFHTIGPNKRWFPIAKGGGYRKWYGNIVDVIDWSISARKYYRTNTAGRIIRKEFWFKPGITWGKISSGLPSFRLLAEDEIYQETAVLQDSVSDAYGLLALLNSKIASHFLLFLSPTLNYQLEDIKAIPVFDWANIKTHAVQLVPEILEYSRTDWDSFENSLGFADIPLLQVEHRRETLIDSYTILRNQWQEMTREMRRLEEENNRVLARVYSLQNELKPDVPLEEITLTCNPHYRYIGKRSEEELECLLQADTMREFISYAVGCMFGRYSLDKPGLVLANQGETVDDYLRQVPAPTFPPDDDNVIPMLDGDWFPDDVSERFLRFLRVTFGKKHYEENLAFIEETLGRDIQSYFIREFYDHHVKMYKKRPFYWLFSSPNGSFNALIYMHRYRPDTASIVLNDYLREFRTKLTARRSHLSGIERSAGTSKQDKVNAVKEMAAIDKTLNELREYEDEILYPLAARQVEIDLDDGVKVNYNKLGAALKRVSGLTE